MRKINVFEWQEKVQNKRYVVEINVVRLYLNIVLTPHMYVNVSLFFLIIYISLVNFCAVSFNRCRGVTILRILGKTQL